jgi:hypothetical protein
MTGYCKSSLPLLRLLPCALCPIKAPSVLLGSWLLAVTPTSQGEPALEALLQFPLQVPCFLGMSLFHLFLLGTLILWYTMHFIYLLSPSVDNQLHGIGKNLLLMYRTGPAMVFTPIGCSFTVVPGTPVAASILLSDL